MLRIASQYEYEVLGTKGGHGRDFAAICNRIGEALGLPPVVIRRRKGDSKTLPICAQWPSNVRPAGYYGDLWDEVTGAPEEGEDPVLRLVAMFAVLTADDQFRFLTHPAVAAVSHGAAAATAPVMANGGEQTEDTAEGLDLRPYLLRAAMERNGWSQAKLAKVAGTSQVTISRIVNGKGNVSDDLVARVLAVAEGQP